MLPEWWNEQLPAIVEKSVRRRSILRRALNGIGTAFSQLLSPPDAGSSPLARFDPRAKVLGIGALIIGTSLLQSIPVLLILLAAVTVILAASYQQVRRATPLFLAVPLFTAVIVLPAMLSIVTPGKLLLTFWAPEPNSTLGPWKLPSEIGISSTGVFVAAKFLLRTTVCVSLVVMLTATTSPDALLDALRRLGMPKSFGMILTMMHRYLVLLLKSTSELHEGRLSRPGGTGDFQGGYKWAAAGIGIVFRRTWHLGQEVYQAMLSRGYDGEIKTLSRGNMVFADWCWIAGCLVAAVGTNILAVLW